MTRSRRITLISLAIALPIMLAAAYGAWWQILADRWRTGLEAWVGRVGAAGWIVSTGTVNVSGFPGTLRLALYEPKAADAAGNGWAGPPMTLMVSPFDPLDPRFAVPGHQIVTLASHAPVEIEAATLEGQVTIRGHGPVAITLTGAKLASQDMTLEGLTLDARGSPPPAEGQIATPLVATIGIDRLTLPETLRLPLDRTVAAAHAAIRLRGTVPRGQPATALAAWRDGGGTVEIDSLDINWPPLVAAGNATVALDKDLQPELAGAMTMRGADKAIDRAAAAGMLTPNAATLGKLYVGAAGKPVADGTFEVTLPLSLQNRSLSVGPVPLVQLPEIEW